MTEQEIRLRCIEAAAKAPNAHPRGYAAGVLEQAKEWYEWICHQGNPRTPMFVEDDGKLKKLL